MDILYQYYFNSLKLCGVNEAIILFLWYFFYFILTCVVFFIVSKILFFIDRKLFNVIYTEEKLPIINFDFFQKNNLSVMLLVIVSVFLWGLIPYSNKYIPLDLEVGSLIFFSCFCFYVFVAVLFISERVEKLDVIKIICRVLSFLTPMFISLLSVVFLASSLRLNDIVLSQSFSQNITGWLVTPDIIGFFVFVFCVVGLFCLVEKTLNVVGFCRYRVSNLRIKLFFISYYSLLFLLACYAACLFLGGYLPPLGFYFSELYNIHYGFNITAVYLEQILWLFIKSFMLVIFIMGLKIKILKLSEEKLIKFSWLFLIPMSVLNLIICMIISLLGGK